MLWQAVSGIKPESAWLNEGQFSPTLNSNLLPWDRISPAHVTMRKAQDEALALKITGCDFRALLEMDGRQGAGLGSRGEQAFNARMHTLETGLFVALFCFISLVWHFTDSMHPLLIQRKIHIIGCEPLRQQLHSSCQTNLLLYKIIILMRYLSVSQATGSDIRCYVPNHRLCPYLPETGNVKDSWFPLIGRD